MQTQSKLDTLSKRRSLPPLNPRSEEDSSKRSDGPARRPKKKKNAGMVNVMYRTPAAGKRDTKGWFLDSFDDSNCAFICWKIPSA